MNRPNMTRFVSSFIIFCSIVMISGCGNSNTNNRTAQTNVPVIPPFERDLDYVRKGNFTHVYVIRRTDNQPLAKDDFTYLKQNSHPQTNMWIKTDEGRRVIAGTNFDWTPENWGELYKRFTIEDYTGM